MRLSAAQLLPTVAGPFPYLGHSSTEQQSECCPAQQPDHNLWRREMAWKPPPALEGRPRWAEKYHQEANLNRTCDNGVVIKRAHTHARTRTHARTHAHARIHTRQHKRGVNDRGSQPDYLLGLTKMPVGLWVSGLVGFIHVLHSQPYPMITLASKLIKERYIVHSKTGMPACFNQWRHQTGNTRAHVSVAFVNRMWAPFPMRRCIRHV